MCTEMCVRAVEPTQPQFDSAKIRVFNLVEHPTSE
jgi:hypothetical protein